MVSENHFAPKSAPLTPLDQVGLQQQLPSGRYVLVERVFHPIRSHQEEARSPSRLGASVGGFDSLAGGISSGELVNLSRAAPLLGRGTIGHIINARDGGGGMVTIGIAIRVHWGKLDFHLINDLKTVKSFFYCIK